MDASEWLATVQHLLASIPGPYGNEHLRLLTTFAGGEDLFADVFAFLTDSGVVDSTSSFGSPPQAPQDAEELATRLAEVDQNAALAILVGMVSQTLAYGVRGRYPADKARHVFETLIALLGYGTRWWTNTDLGSWNPVTHHTMDALVVGTGGGILVAVLAVDED